MNIVQDMLNMKMKMKMKNTYKTKKAPPYGRGLIPIGKLVNIDPAFEIDNGIGIKL